MPSPSLYIHRLIGGMAVIALVILIGPLLKQHSSQQLLSQGGPPSPSGGDSGGYGDVFGGGSTPPIIPCSSDDDCHDTEPCTIDRCLSGMCSHEPNSTDTDNDNTPDCVDQCPSDPIKTEPQQCGCNNEETSPCEESDSAPPPPPPAPSPSPDPSPPPPAPAPSVSSAIQPPATLPPIASDCTKCSSVREICAKSRTFTYIHHTQKLCACFDAWTSPEGWLLCVWQDSPLSSRSSLRPLPPPPHLLARSISSAISSSLAPRSLDEVGSSSVFSLPSHPPVCGDGFIQTPDEKCDDGATNSYLPNACRPYCQRAWCGDGITDTQTENCDAGAVCIGGLLDGPQCAGFGCVRGDPNCISPEACEKGGGTCDFVGDSACTLYCTSRKTASSAASSSSVPLGLMEFFQKSCLRCGDGWFNLCDQQECESFGPCSYQTVVGSFFGTCTIDASDL